MDRIHKFLKKLSSNERQTIKGILRRIKKGEFVGLDIKKLKGVLNIFRVRKGNIRIILLKNEDVFVVMSVERRNDTTYK